MLVLNWILIGILIAAGLYEALLIATSKRTITQKYQDLDSPGWLNLLICVSIAVFQYFLYVKWNVQIHPFIVALYNIILGHIFGRF